jgi:hypothetical protein
MGADFRNLFDTLASEKRASVSKNFESARVFRDL